MERTQKKMKRAGSPADPEAAAFAHLKRTDPRLHKEALRHKGAILSRVQPKRTNAALFRALCSSIVNQQLSTKAAQSIFRRLEGTLGGSVTPAAISAAPPSHLRSAGLSEAKVLSLKAFAQAVESNEIDLLKLKRLPPEEAVQRLTQIRGIGPWTAEMFLIFALGAPDIFSPGDLILARRAQKLFNLPENVSKKELARLAERWSPHRSFVSLLFWRLHHEEQDTKARGTTSD